MRILLALAILAAVPQSALPYAHFLHYTASGAPVPEKFNLAQLPNKTVFFFVSDTGPAAYSSNDSFPSVLNQVRRAAEVWNGVATSDVRVAYGGTASNGIPDNSPGGAVVFEDLPPGVLAYSGPTSCEDTANGAPPACQSQAPADGDSFVPILRSTMHLSRDLSQLPGPSYSELFFLVTVHEMGHALGLQHTFASSTMSTVATRNTSLTNPLGDDDIAAISVLYPVAASATAFGSISGTITYNDDGSPVHMASVVAVSSAATVSALTLSDGSFQINGLQPGSYYLYVHPLPPTADIRSPLDPSDTPVNPTEPFNAVLFPGVLNPADATLISVSAGETSGGNNLAVTRRSSIPIYDVSLYSYFAIGDGNANPVHPAYVDVDAAYGTVVASGVGVASNGAETPGLSVQTLGGISSVYAQSGYGDTNGNNYLAIYLQFSTFGAPGKQHLLFSLPDYLYLLPNAFNVAPSAPPQINGVITNADGTVTVSGSGFSSATRLYFDSLPGSVLSADTTNQLIVVAPPAGASGQVATVTAYNPDGQNSAFLLSGAPWNFTYPANITPTLTISPNQLPAGAEASLDIQGVNTNFAASTIFGFGTHDIIVQRTWILSPTHAIADIGIPAGAAQPLTEVSALSGFQLATSSGAFQINSAQAGLPAPYPILFNGVQNQTGSWAGAIVSLYGANLQAAPNATPVITIGGQTASLLYSSANLINLQIPGSLPAGPTTLLLSNGAVNAFPITVNIDPPEPVIQSILLGGNPVDPAAGVQDGNTLDAIVSGFSASDGSIDASRVNVNIGGVQTAAVSVTRTSAGLYDVQFAVPSAVVPASQVPVVVYLDGQSSVPAALTVSP